MPKKSATGRGKKRRNEGGEETSPPAKVTKTAAEGEWRASIIRECWLKKLTEEEHLDIPELMKRIKDLKDKAVTGESVAYSFIERRIQPLQQRIHLGFEYQGLQNPSRMARDVPSIEEIMCRVTRLFTGVNSDPYTPRLFGAGNPPDSKSETPKPATSSTTQAGTGEDSLPKEPATASTAEPPIGEDVPAANEGKDFEPQANPEVEQEAKAPGTTPGATTDEGTWADQQAVASTPD
ncbi:hypothetical protein C2845_PM05G19650 [Panicum miliaceum]|uniref:Uncharacterized protein n=1 Tax=Panicum miliaceum TaxID=4540 RepID=A0A3L6T3Z2_PANMI|nr:hypothetical protein C2845_PM05G19650 [Panicum miliaceum]